jgi:hypothetical protein
VNERPSIWSKIGYCLLAPYILGVWLSLPYFNWLYAHEHGFWEWVFCGEIEPSIQAFIWPYYALSRGEKEWTKEEKANIAHFIRATKIMERVKGIMASNPSDEEDIRKVAALFDEALVEVMTLRDDVLAKADPSIPDVVHNKLTPYLRLNSEAMHLLLSGGDAGKVRDLALRAAAIGKELEDWSALNAHVGWIPGDIPE